MRVHELYMTERDYSQSVMELHYAWDYGQQFQQRIYGSGIQFYEMWRRNWLTGFTDRLPGERGLLEAEDFCPNHPEGYECGACIVTQRTDTPARTRVN